MKSVIRPWKAPETADPGSEMQGMQRFAFVSAA
jgi:hypothetical protein